VVGPFPEPGYNISSKRAPCQGPTKPTDTDHIDKGRKKHEFFGILFEDVPVQRSWWLIQAFRSRAYHDDPDARMVD
jgi:hypothetical protein